MIGGLFARTLKQNVDLRHDFEEWIKAQRANASGELEAASADVAIFHAQGKIRALDTLKNSLDQMMNLPADAETFNGKN